MRKVIFTFLAIVFLAGLGYSQVTTLWEKSQATGTLPVWDGASLTRGLSYGQVGANHYLFVVTRSAALGGKQIIYYNAATGDSLGRLDTTGVTGGTYPVCDVEVSTNGKIFVSNLTTNVSTSSFKVYRYDTLTSAPVLAIDYMAGAVAERLGDKFTVTGSTADNSIIIWAASAAIDGNIYKFTTADNGLTFTPTVISKATFGGSASIGPLPNQDFYYNYQGISPQKYTAAGTLIGDIPSAVVGTGSNAIRFLKSIAGDEYFTTIAFGAGLEHGRIVRVPGGVPTAAVLYAATPTLGSISAGGLGDISVRQVSTLVYNVYALSTNNGFGAYKVTITPTLAGDYYIGAPGTGPGGSNPQFASLREAFDVLNDAKFTGDCIFYITSDLNETYGTPFVGLGLAINPEPYTVTFKPYTGVQPVVTFAYPTDGNSGPSGAMIIGIPSKGNVTWDSLRVTKNIIIDGSNTPNGTTRDLTLQSSTTAQRNAIPLVVVGEVSNLTVKNTNIYYKVQVVSTSGSLFIGGIMVRSRNYLNVDWSPHDMLFENNHISANFDGVAQNAQGYGTYQSGAPNVLNYPYNITLRNNLIEGKRRALGIYRAGNHNIFGNEIVLNQTIAAGITSEAVYYVDCDTTSIFSFYNNKISKVSGITTGTAVGLAAINIEAYGTYNIFNNMITGFELTAANPTAYLNALRSNSAVATVNFVFNTVFMNDIAATGTGVVSYQGLYIKTGTTNLLNNIVVTNEPDFANYCIYRDLLAGTLASDYNDLYSASPLGNVGFWNTAAALTLADWRTASSMDANSVSKLVNFVSVTDLHLAATSQGDQDLKAFPVAEITFDFDNDLRDNTSPYKGADEAPVILPVELTSFTAALNGTDVLLKWRTATEINSSYFEVERKSSGAEWTAIGKVNAAGTTTQPVMYSFTDQNVSGKVSYRLKQVDQNGLFTYSEEVELDATVPLEFSMSQNYPNPFNPSTKINYSVAFDTRVNISVYSITGELVKELVNEFMPAGRYTVDFNASNLSSGLYIYKISAGEFNQTSKMMLLK